MEISLKTMMDEKTLIKKSKYLSKLLRHDPKGANLIMNNEGWVSVRQLLNNTSFTMEIIEKIVVTNNKQRFEFNEDKSKIRARQGHSIDVDLKYKKANPPEYLYHGTAKKNFYDIWVHGLQKMKRHHVHLSSDHETALKVGQRHGEPIVLTIYAQQLHKNGVNFYKTENNVWLVSSVSPDFIFINDNGIKRKLR